MKLSLAAVGENRVISAMNLPGPLEHRLEALGMTRGTRVQVLAGKNRGTLIIRVRGCRLAVGRGITGRIEVS